MDDFFKYEELAEFFPFVSKFGVKRFNEKIKQKLQEIRLIPICKEHVPRFTKLAFISTPEFEANQWGYKCFACGIRLHPESFVPYESEKHYKMYREPENKNYPKSPMEIAKDLVK